MAESDNARPLQRLTEIRQRFSRVSNMLIVKTDIKRGGYQYTIPGFKFDDFDKMGHASHQKIVRVFESLRYNRGIDFTSSGDIIMDAVMLGYNLEITRKLYEVAAVDFPMIVDRYLTHIGKSSFSISQRMMDATTGERVAASTPDIAADLFAKGFTQNFDKLQREFPVYGRLRHIFDLAVALEIVRSEMERGNGKAFSAIHDPKCQPRLPTAPREIDSVASTHKDKSGSISAIVSGGVSINLNELPKRLTTDWIKTKNVMIESSYGSSIGQREESENPLISPFVDKPFWR